MATFINLTPHAIVLQKADGTRTTVAPSGSQATVRSVAGDARAPIEGVQVFGPNTWGEVAGLPGPQADTVYIVSALVGARVARADVVMPGTGPADGAVRFPDGPQKGQIEAVTRLIATA